MTKGKNRKGKNRKVVKVSEPSVVLDNLPSLLTVKLELCRRDLLAGMDDLDLFGPWFQDESWIAWRVFLKALFGRPMNQKELEIYQLHTGRKTPPSEPVHEAWAVVGRRGGKSRIAALLAVHRACLFDYNHILAPGELATIPIIASDRFQARVILGYVKGLIDSIPAFRYLLKAEPKAESVELTNRTVIEIHTASYRATRGYTVVACIGDEVAFWRSETSANPDVEILRAIRPGMASVSDGLLLCISSPYARRGALWDAYRNHYGQDGDPVLVWQADTRTMNPTIAQDIVAAEYSKDAESASAEYGAQFRRDVEQFIPEKLVRDLTVVGRCELPCMSSQYYAFVDPSGGSEDSMTLAIAHREGEKIILDLVRENVPPFSPEAVTAEYVELLSGYGLERVVGDRYAGEWPREQFRKRGVQYLTSDESASELYLELVPLLTSGRVELLDNSRLASQLIRLERRTRTVGRDLVTHPPGGHDDVVNVAAGALVLASRGKATEEEFPGITV